MKSSALIRVIRTSIIIYMYIKICTIYTNLYQACVYFLLLHLLRTSSGSVEIGIISMWNVEVQYAQYAPASSHSSSLPSGRGACTSPSPLYCDLLYSIQAILHISTYLDIDIIDIGLFKSCTYSAYSSASAYIHYYTTTTYTPITLGHISHDSY
jgi:hypothetical protein